MSQFMKLALPWHQKSNTILPASKKRKERKKRKEKKKENWKQYLSWTQTQNFQNILAN